MRLLGELEYSERAGFVTWTYSEQPPNGSLCKRDLQLAFKRLRKAVDSRKVRYYACGEYGEKHKRAHYHGIVFGIDWRDRQVVSDTWGKGRTQVGTVTADSVLYVCDYATKSVLGKGAVEAYDEKGLERPFSVCSRGLGAAWCDAHANSLVAAGLLVDGVPVGVPRYFARRLGLGSLDDPWREARKADQREREKEVSQVHEERVARGEFVDVLESLWASRHQREITLGARRELRKKGSLS